jgi:ribosomal protein L19E
MCGEHHEHHGHRGRGLRGRRGYPSREQWVERLQAYRQHLDEEQKNVQELIERLGEAPQQTANV